MHKILVVDDDKILNISIVKLLRKNGFEVKSSFNGKYAIDLCREENFDAVILDFRLPDFDGFQVLQAITKFNSQIPVIMLTSFGDIKKAVTAIKLGAYDYLTKPFEKEELLNNITKACESVNSTHYELDNLKEMMGNSTPLQKVMQNVNRVADKDITVFLEGETGTGKELFARMIHQKSHRKDKPFIAVDCGAIPESLFESVLFGHEKGAFTGAFTDKKGKFELCEGGTIFLDEVNSLPLDMQPKFLRVLQESEIQKLGSENPQKIDLRIIAASNNNIDSDVKTGTFREDLYYRIHEFKINLPTLIERKDDIITIATYFLKEICIKFQKEVSGFSVKAEKKLLNYSWPGNIRELNNVIKSAVLLTSCTIIQENDLVLRNIRKEGIDLNNHQDLNLENYTTQTEVSLINKALQKAKFNKTEAAKLLGISRGQFYSKLEKYNIS